MSEHVNTAMDRIEVYLDSAIAEKNAETTEKSDSKIWWKLLKFLRNYRRCIHLKVFI